MYQFSRNSGRVVRWTNGLIGSVGVFGAVIAFGMAASPVAAQDAPPDNRTAPRSAPSFVEIDKPEISGDGGYIPVQIVDGRLVFTCDIAGPARRIPVNLWLDFDGAYGLQLHNRAAAPLPAETGDGKALALTLYFPDFTMRVPRRELGDEEAFEDFTKYHSAEIGENALVGALGAHYLKHFGVVFDLPTNRVFIRPLGNLEGESPGIEDDKIIVPITEHNDLVWLPVELEDKRDLALAIGSINYDTIVDAALCEQMMKPAGDIGKLQCRSFDFAEYVALRPEELIQVHPDGVAGVMGINLLESFRVEIDRRSRLAAITRRRPADFPEADLKYFQARTREEAQPIADWLTEHADERLAAEAAELLLTLRLEEGADEAEALAAVTWVNDTTQKDLRATRMLDLMEELSNEGEMYMVIAAGDIGVASGRVDRYPDAVHKIHSRMGEVMLDKDQDMEAWRHLLSAAFGLPEDGMINLSLGRYYEKAGRYRRAFSRYIQAVIKEESGPQAMAGLQRIDEKMPDEDRLSLEVIERMIAGKVQNYGAPMKFDPDADGPVSNRTVLVEFFTNSFLGTEARGGAIGGALGNQGLISHFEPEHVVFLSYHLPKPKPDPLINELGIHTARKLFQRNDPMEDVLPAQIIDGQVQAPGAGKWRDAEAIFNASRRAILPRLTVESDYELSMEATLVDGRVSGTLTVQGPAATSDISPVAAMAAAVGSQGSGSMGVEMPVVQIVLAERGVIFPGASGVIIHRQLARGVLLDSPDGLSYKPDSQGRMTIDFDRALADLELYNEQYLDQLEADGVGSITRMSTKIDPALVTLVAIVRDRGTFHVHQVLQVTPETNEEAILAPHGQGQQR